MVLCEMMDASELGFFEVWASLTVLSWVSLLLTSGTPFYWYYYKPTYETWLLKTNRRYPAPSMVREAAYKSLTGVPFVTLSPTLALYLAKLGYGSQAYCGVRYGWGELLQIPLIFLFTDFFEWGWHYLGHRVSFLWSVHQPHHRYHNPEPFSVIADEWPDEVVRGSPLFLIPMIMPTNLEMLFGVFLLFNFYGTAIHTGIDFEVFNIHGTGLWRLFNLPYHHHVHHAVSTKNKALHTGFFLRIWDLMAGSVYEGRCLCSACDAKEGNRTREAYDALEKPDYSVLLSPRYWLEWQSDEDVKSGAAAAVAVGAKEE